MGAHHGHDHGHAAGHGSAERALWWALSLNAGFLVVEAVAGWWSNSLALLSDAGHMLTDVGALALALAASRLSHRRGNDEYTYGLHRFPIMGGLINAASLLVVVVLIVREAVERLWVPVEVDAWPVLLVGSVGLVVNGVSAWVLHRSGEQDVNIRGAMLHLFADALGSVAAIASAVVLMTSGWILVDPLLSLVIAGLVLWGSLPLLRETFAVMLERAPQDIPVASVRRVLDAHPQVHEVLDLHVWQVGPGQSVLTAVLSSASGGSVQSSAAAADELREQLGELGISHVTIEWRHPTSPAPSPCTFEHEHLAS